MAPPHGCGDAYDSIGRVVTVPWSLLYQRPDGTAVWEVVDSYHLCKFRDEWRLLDRTIHD